MTRFSRLFKADMHAVMDSIEEPGALLKQSLREMEEVILNDEASLVHSSEQCRQVEQFLDEMEKLLAKDKSELTLCLDSNNEDLARTIIRKKLEREKFKGIHQSKKEKLEYSIAELKERIHENKMALELMRQKADVLIDNQSEEGAGYQDVHVSDDDVEVALLREKRARSQS